MNDTNSKEQKTALEIIARVFNISEDTITLDARLEDIALDSLQLFSLILAFEEHYSTQVEYDDLVKIETVGDIVAYINRRKV